MCVIKYMLAIRRKEIFQLAYIYTRSVDSCELYYIQFMNMFKALATVAKSKLDLLATWVILLALSYVANR